MLTWIYYTTSVYHFSVLTVRNDNFWSQLTWDMTANKTMNIQLVDIHLECDSECNNCWSIPSKLHFCEKRPDTANSSKGLFYTDLKSV